MAPPPREIPRDLPPVKADFPKVAKKPFASKRAFGLDSDDDFMSKPKSTTNMIDVQQEVEKILMQKQERKVMSRTNMWDDIVKNVREEEVIL